MTASKIIRALLVQPRQRSSPDRRLRGVGPAAGVSAPASSLHPMKSDGRRTSRRPFACRHQRARTSQPCPPGRPPRISAPLPAGSPFGGILLLAGALITMRLTYTPIGGPRETYMALKLS
jgi:hypothetical protein